MQETMESDLPNPVNLSGSRNRILFQLDPDLAKGCSADWIKHKDVIPTGSGSTVPTGSGNTGYQQTLNYFFLISQHCFKNLLDTGSVIFL